MTLQHGADHCTESAFTGSWDHHHPYMVGMRGRAGQESKLSENVPRQLNSYVKLNFNYAKLH